MWWRTATSLIFGIFGLFILWKIHCQLISRWSSWSAKIFTSLEVQWVTWGSLARTGILAEFHSVMSLWQVCQWWCRSDVAQTKYFLRTHRLEQVLWSRSPRREVDIPCANVHNINVAATLTWTSLLDHRANHLCFAVKNGSLLEQTWSLTYPG